MCYRKYKKSALHMKAPDCIVLARVGPDQVRIQYPSTLVYYFLPVYFMLALAKGAVISLGLPEAMHTCVCRHSMCPYARNPHPQYTTR